ncbi:hypothetical protein TRFO_26079 [Tritrichomonas foetus]|uniref:Uncharacterized protein n=1 Tax=Tritrichomonas foetus TaxID=1144522 RepID=A0A1J4K8L2_9EUKA|nr:hypothetical protein TRFO_26079 [Tritrichomonas foetus]|eukprot:OHT06006.1 hypothetical protein TRFO_26079 [Tritrichomonas foetus]
MQNQQLFEFYLEICRALTGQSIIQSEDGSILPEINNQVREKIHTIGTSEVLHKSLEKRYSELQKENEKLLSYIKIIILSFDLENNSNKNEAVSDEEINEFINKIASIRNKIKYWDTQQKLYNLQFSLEPAKEKSLIIRQENNSDSFQNIILRNNNQSNNIAGNINFVEMEKEEEEKEKIEIESLGEADCFLNKNSWVELGRVKLCLVNSNSKTIFRYETQNNVKSEFPISREMAPKIGTKAVQVMLENVNKKLELTKFSFDQPDQARHFFDSLQKEIDKLKL